MTSWYEAGAILMSIAVGYVYRFNADPIHIFEDFLLELHI